MLKKDLRKIYSEKRNNLSQEEINRLSEKIFIKLKETDSLVFNVYHCFLSIENKKEINTSFIIKYLLKNKKGVSVSKSDFSTNSMTNYKYDGKTTLKVNKWGIPEPVDAEPINDNTIDVIFVPLLAFDRKGNRVGYGKGFYDRFFKNCRKNALKIGLSLFEAVDEIEDINSDDVPLDYCITPNNIYNFTI